MKRTRHWKSTKTITCQRQEKLKVTSVVRETLFSDRLCDQPKIINKREGICKTNSEWWFFVGLASRVQVIGEN